MDVALLAKMVRELILDKDSVTLPGLGSFVAEEIPSSFSDKGYTINPPYRRLSFTPREGRDTLLADLYAVSNGVSKEAAQAALSEFVSGLRETLMSRKAVAIPGLGRLRATRENHFFFVPDEDPDIDPNGFGLYPISLKTHQETPEEVSAAVSDLAAAFAPAPAPAPAPVPEAPVDPAPETETPPSCPTPTFEPAPSVWRRIVVIALVLLAVFALLLILLAILGRMAPNWVDPFLYTREELELLKL